MQKEETYQTENLGQPLIDAGTGYFTLPESGDLHIEVDASTDDGTLHVVMTDTDGPCFLSAGRPDFGRRTDTLF